MDTTTLIYNTVSSTEAMLSQRLDWIIILLMIWILFYGIGFIKRFFS